MLKPRVETIYPEIVGPEYLWLDTVIEEWDFRDQEEQTPGPHAPATPKRARVRRSRIPDYGDRRVVRLVPDDRLAGVAIKQSRVPWSEVRQLAFAFDEQDWSSVRGFYASYGPLGDPLYADTQLGLRERMGWAKAATGWFRELTVLVEALQNDRTGRLWERFGPPRELALGDETDPIYLVGPHMLGDGPGLDYCIRWVPTVGKRGRCLTPQTEKDLYDATWQVVIQAVEHELARIHLTPIMRDCDDARHPQLEWGFKVDGALDEAFLDWFFGVFAPLKVRTCAARGCTNPVLPPRWEYCSDACKNRQKQRDYRERHKKSAEGRL